MIFRKLRFFVVLFHILKLSQPRICPTQKLSLKGTVSVISSDPSNHKWRCLIINGPIKAWSDQVWIRYSRFCFRKWFTIICGFWTRKILRISCLSETTEKFTEINTFRVKNDIFFHIFYQNNLKSTVGNWALLSLHGGLIKIIFLGFLWFKLFWS